MMADQNKTESYEMVTTKVTDSQRTGDSGYTADDIEKTNL